MKGIVLAAGAGTRLYPASIAVNKQLLPVYDKPMIYYPLATLMQAGIRDLLLIVSPTDLPLFRALLGNGGAFGIKISYLTQPKPGGIVQALLLAEDFTAGASCALILGDNFFFGAGLPPLLRQAAATSGRATVFSYRVEQPQRYGIVTTDEHGRALSLAEKPAASQSRQAVTGLYFYDEQAMTLAKQLRPSSRGEYEITDLNKLYLRAGLLEVIPLPASFFWLDMGEPEHLLLAANFVRQTELADGPKIAVLEQIAHENGWLSACSLRELAQNYSDSAYGRYLRQYAGRQTREV